MGFRELVHILVIRTCRDPDVGQILTTTDAPSAFALVGHYRGEVRERNLLTSSFCLFLRYLQSGDCPMNLFASLWTYGFNWR